MNIIKMAGAGAGLLLLALVTALDNSRAWLKAALGIKPEPLEHGTFRLTQIVPNGSAKRAMVAASLLFVATGCLVGALALHGAGLGHVLAYLCLGMGAAGTFAAANPPNAPLPQYTFRGVYTGGTSDTSPLSIPFATYNATFALRCNGVAPIPDVYVVQTLGNVTAIGVTCTATNLVLTFTSSGSALSGFVASLGAFIPNTVTEK